MVDPDLEGEEEIQWAQELRRLLLQQGIRHCDQALTHASRCHSRQCPDPCCPEMKRVVRHVQSCVAKAAGGCLICGQLSVLASLHARQCRAEACPVPFCPETRCVLRRHDPQECQRRRRRLATGEAERMEMRRARAPLRLQRFLMNLPRPTRPEIPTALHAPPAQGSSRAPRVPTLLSVVTQDPLQELERGLQNLSTVEEEAQAARAVNQPDAHYPGF